MVGDEREREWGVGSRAELVYDDARNDDCHRWTLAAWCGGGGELAHPRSLFNFFKFFVLIC